MAQGEGGFFGEGFHGFSELRLLGVFAAAGAVLGRRFIELIGVGDEDHFLAAEAAKEDEAVLGGGRSWDGKPSVRKVSSDADKFSRHSMANLAFALKLTVIGAKLFAFHAGVADDRRMSGHAVATYGAGDEFLFHGFLF